MDCTCYEVDALLVFYGGASQLVAFLPPHLIFATAVWQFTPPLSVQRGDENRAANKPLVGVRLIATIWDAPFYGIAMSHSATINSFSLGLKILQYR